MCVRTIQKRVDAVVEKSPVSQDTLGHLGDQGAIPCGEFLNCEGLLPQGLDGTIS
jgi:hypothetical protein